MELAYADVSAKGGERRQPRIDGGGGAPNDSCEWSRGLRRRIDRAVRLNLETLTTARTSVQTSYPINRDHNRPPRSSIPWVQHCAVAGTCNLSDCTRKYKPTQKEHSFLSCIAASPGLVRTLATLAVPCDPSSALSMPVVTCLQPSGPQWHERDL